MHCLKNINRFVLNNDHILKLTKLYQSKGKDFYYETILKKNIEAISNDIAIKDTFFMSKILFQNMTDQRIKLISKENNVPQNNQEKLVLNIKNTILLTHQKSSDFNINSISITDMAKYLFKGVRTVKYAKYKDETKKDVFSRNKSYSKEVLLDELCELYLSIKKEDKHEVLLLILNFYIDFLNLEIYESDNELIGLLLVSLLLQNEGFKVFKYSSFYELYYEQLDVFKMAITQASFNWEQGYSQIYPLFEKYTEVLNKCYLQTEEFIRDFEFEQGLKKGDNIENSIYKVGEIFTKDELRLRHPYVSDSTINRTLVRLRDDGIINPLGTGRSAKWIRVVDKPSKVTDYEQLSIFEVEEIFNEE